MIPKRTLASVSVLFMMSCLLAGAKRISSAEPRPRPAQQRPAGTTFEFDPFWPKPYPGRWVTGESGGICTDAQDHIFTINRGDLTPTEQKTASASPPVIEFDPAGNIVNSWGDRDALPKGLHSCTVDFQGNIWIGGNQDAIVQKYAHDGSKMLLQIGTKGLFDTSDGTFAGAAMNSSHTLLNLPASIAVDASNGDVYIADGYGNRRIVVFDKDGHFLRQWGRQGTVAETDSGTGGVFLKVVHCVVIGNDGFLYVCDRLGDRVEVFDKMGNFKRNIVVESKTARQAGVGSVCGIAFSPDAAQKYLYVGACVDGEVRVMDRASGEDVARFGRPGNQAGGFGSVHTLTIDSKGSIFVADSMGRRIQKWKAVN